ncbi:MAG TPA: hypothetical protein DCZ75_12845 [Geobacter sp.]|nr:hypothetical protein [Geobacter sp.]
MTGGSRARRWAFLAAEAVGSLLLVLALFWLFILFLYALFPSGTPLKELMQSRTDQLPARDAAGNRPEAALKLLVRDVRFRRGNSVAWGGAREGMLLYSHDAVQTFDRSEATITFSPSDLIQVGSNSLVLVTRLNENVETGPRSYRVQVDGELRGTLSASKTLRMELATAGHLARIVPGAAKFRITPNGDDGSSLAVYGGEARVLGKHGVVRVPASYGITLRNGVSPGPAVPLPSPPPLKDDKLIYRYRLLPPKIRFAWGGEAGQYHFQLAREPGFKRPLLDKNCPTPHLDAGTLEAGEYFWRVSRIEEGREGAFSRVGRCRLLQLLKPPQLRIDAAGEQLPAGAFRLTGSAEPGSRTFVNGVEVAGDQEGKFSHELQLKPGVNLVRVEALDAAGNASYASRVLYGRTDAF